MAASPIWKIYDADGAYQAACHEAEAAASLVSFYGAGASIRYGHAARVWVEGEETQPAAESYDYVASQCWRRRKLWEEAIRTAPRGKASTRYLELVSLEAAAAVGAGLAKAGL